MNISSHNITDVSYHYIGLRVLDGLTSASKRSEQIEAVSRSVLKFVSDRALRLMLDRPRGTYESTGEKIYQELVHFQFARLASGRYELTEEGRGALSLLNNQQYTDLRRLMVRVHLQTYDNLRVLVQTHLTTGAILSPIVKSPHLSEINYAEKFLKPTFDGIAGVKAKEALDNLPRKSPSKVEDALRAKILQHAMPSQKMGVALFRSMCDRLISLRLLNKSHISIGKFDFEKTYSPCVTSEPSHSWYDSLQILLDNGELYEIYLCEPDMANKDHQELLLDAINKAFSELQSRVGYYDIPELRNWVCEYLMIPEAAFDDGLNRLLDRTPPLLSVGLQYDKITSQRKPLVRIGQTAQLHNLIRRF